MGVDENLAEMDEFYLKIYCYRHNLQANSIPYPTAFLCRVPATAESAARLT